MDQGDSCVGMCEVDSDKVRRYEDWLTAQARKLSEVGYVPSGEKGPPGGFSRKGDLLFHRDAGGFPDAMMELKLHSVKSEYAGGIWQVSIYVDDRARRKGLAKRMLNLCEGQVRKRVEELRRQGEIEGILQLRTRRYQDGGEREAIIGGQALIANVVLPPKNHQEYGRIHDWSVRYLLNHGYTAIEQENVLSGEKGVVYQKAIDLDV